MKCRNNILFIYLFIILLIGCKKQTTEEKIEEILKVNFSLYCDSKNIDSEFKKLGFKNNGKRLQKYLGSNLYCSMDYYFTDKLSNKYFFLSFWEGSQEIEISHGMKNNIVNCINKVFGISTNMKNLQEKNIGLLNDYELPYWDNENYHIYLYDAYALWGCTEIFENFKIIIQVK